MSRHFFSHLFTGMAIGAGLLFGSAAFAADATIEQVYAAADGGHLAQAQQMMRDVLRDHPDSGKAHFVEAELLAKQGNLAGARSELTKAERLAPGLPFAKVSAVQELEGLLRADSLHAAGTSLARASHGASWGWIAAALAAVAMFAYWIRQRAHNTATAPSYGYGYANYGSGAVPQSAGYGSAPAASGGLGSGLFGSLATGAAVGAGVVAGEALMHRVLDGSNSQSMVAPLPSPVWDDMQQRERNDSNYDMGGKDFGLNDDASWNDGTNGITDSGNDSYDDWS